MIEKNKPALFLFFLFFLINQNYDIQGQNNVQDLIRQRFQSYLEDVPLEEVFIHTDRDEYISGEDLWFAIYLIDRQGIKPSAMSRIAYFELLNTENRPVIQKRIYLENGFGPGQLTLPDTLSTGTYTIRAYTNWMKNFLPQNCFVWEITIYNPFNNKSLKVIPDNSGINHVTDLDSNGQPVFSTYNFTPSGDTAAISINSGERFGVREKVVVRLEMARSLADKIKSGNLSISVTPFTKGSHRADIIKKNPIDWSKILSGKISVPVYKTERDFHFLRGRLTSGDKPLSSSEYVLLCIPGKEPDFQYAKTDSAGNFSFNIHIDESIKDLVLMADDETSMKKIILESGFAEQFSPARIATGNAHISIPQYLNDWSVNYQIRKIYGVSSSESPVERTLPPLRPVRFYGKPDIELIMADYVILPKMEEVFFELLPHVSMKKRNSGYEILITDRIMENRYESWPALFLDGVKINDASIFEDLDPSIVERIDVIKEKYFVGDYSFPGLVNITTRSSDFTTIPLPDYMIRLPYNVIDPVKSFISPDYSSSDMKNSPIPDFRNTLYWNPSIKPDSEGKFRIEFWTSDYMADYEINVQGITSWGEIISARKIFRVE